MAISRTDLENLIEHKGHLLSVYADVDQSRAANLNRGFTAALKDRLRSLEQQLGDDKAKRECAACIERVLAFVSAYEPRARGLAIFCDAQDFFWQRELNIGVGNEVRWDEKAYVRPLVEALDEYERYGVVLISREEARLFTAFLGEIEEHREIFSPERRKHIKSPGSDHPLSQMTIQHKEDEHAHWHLKQVADALEGLAGQHAFDRLVLAGPHEITRELQGLLSKRLQALVVRSIGLPMTASEPQVLKETQRVEEEVEREAELRTVEELITAASKDSQAVLELQPTLDALRLGRILKLVYSHDFAVPGVQCTNCDSLFAGDLEACAYCRAKVRPVQDVVGRLVDIVIDSGGKTEDVRGAAAARLEQAGRIGAFLRF